MANKPIGLCVLCDDQGINLEHKRKWINPLGYEKLSIAHDLNRGLFGETSKNRGLSNYRETSKNRGLSGNHEIPGRKIKLGWQTNQLVYT